jgi:hypothetical protein
MLRWNAVDDQERDDRDRVIRSLGAGFLVRWDQHDPESLEQEVGPITRRRPGERKLEEAWFD